VAAASLNPAIMSPARPTYTMPEEAALLGVSPSLL
jgi:hypothetical protein